MHKYKLDDLVLDFTLTRYRNRGHGCQVPCFDVAIYKGDKHIGTLRDYMPGPTVKNDVTYIQDVIGFATCPNYYDWGPREEWDADQREWYSIYQAIGGEHSIYAALAEDLPENHYAGD